MSRALASLERWFQREVTGPGASSAAKVVRPSARLAPGERVAIYRRMVAARFRECLEEDYPAVAKLCGAEAFGRLVRAYLRAHPSRHYSLNVLGRRLPEFLDRAERFPRRALLADVARVERAISESFDATVTRALTPADLALVPPDRLAAGRIRLNESVRLLALRHRANAVVSACRQGRELPSTRPARTWVAVYRKEWTVWRADLTEPMHAALAALAKGKPLPRALAAARRAHGGSPEALREDVGRWFGEWSSEGFFAEVAGPGPPRRAS